MTRPQIIRADTLDLQDKTSPTAQDHSRQPQHPAPLGIGPAAPHQQASLRQVTDEQSSEESQLRQSVWSNATTLRDDPGSDDERTILNEEGSLQQDEQAVRLNGGIPGGADDGEMADADDDDLDDDMMDKISSSPSIDDGGYLSPHTHTHTIQWPRRSTSLTPSSTPTRVQSYDPTSNPASSSSPFTTTPLHFPIRSAAARRQEGTLVARSGPACTSPKSSPPSPTLSFLPAWSTEHHREREYTSSLESPGPEPDREPLEEDDGSLPQDDSNLSLIVERWEKMMQNSRRSSDSSGSDDIDTSEAVPFGEYSRMRWEQIKDRYERPLSPASSSSWTTDSDLDSVLIPDGCDDDDSNDVSFSSEPRFIDSGWGGECLRETEDIDFEFVYALHTFVATVEGQANATKGDTMVLLDDSNSYWWLVRVVKDSSIGYLPAEHIETPTERLARLNKHRNIDLSATMLGDTAEKTKNPLKKAMRRRNAKTVQFAAPTYVEASDYDYSSSDEDGDEELFGGADPNQVQADGNNESPESEQDENLKVQPLKVNGAKKDTTPGSADDEITPDTNNDASNNADKPRSSDEIFDRPLDQKISRNGTLRNTDSFFKDDNAETRKITLTPNLLRDDSSTSTTGSRERGPSLESLEKNGFADKVKEDKKKKEKKPGMLSGLFKRKEKKPKGSSNLDSFDSDVEKVSEEFGRSSPQQRVLEEKQAERPSTDTETVHSPQRQPSRGKLQKPQRAGAASPSKIKSPETSSPPLASPKDVTSKEAPSARPPGTQATMRLVSAEADEPVKTPVEARVQSPEGARARANSAASKLNPMNMIHRQPSDREARPEKVKKAKQRVQLDDFDSPIEDPEDPFADPKAEQDKAQQSNTDPTGRLSESPVQILPSEVQAPEKEASREKVPMHDPTQPPGLTGDTSSQDTGSPISTPSREDSPSSNAPSKPSLSATRPPRSPSPTSLTQAPLIPPPSRPAPVPKIDTSPPDSSSSSLPAWSDASLRSYLDDGSDIRDMLMVINDTNGIVPVGPEHPIMAGLFVEERKTMVQLGGELDGLLSEWLERKRKRGGGPVVAPATKILR